jgi:hypothetical protein
MHFDGEDLHLILLGGRMSVRLLQHKFDFYRDTCDIPLNSHRPSNLEVEGTQTAS